MNITPSDSLSLATVVEQVIAAVAGNVKADLVGGGTVTFAVAAHVPSGKYRMAKIYATGTTATGLRGVAAEGRTAAADPVLAVLVSSISPAVAASTGQALTVTGSNLQYAVGVSLGGVACTSVAVNAAGTSITCLQGNVSAVPLGACDVVVTADDASTGTLVGGFTIPTPTVVSLSVATGSTTGGTPVTVTGTHFDWGTVESVKFGGTDATDVVRQNATAIDCTTEPHAAGAVDVVVRISAANYTLAGAFTFAAGVTVTGISPSVMTDWRDGVEYIIEFSGTTLDDLNGVSTVTIAGASVDVNGPVDATHLSVVTSNPFDPTVPGTYDVVVTIGGVPYTLVGGFTIPTSGLVSIDPASGTVLGSEEVALVGHGFNGGFTAITFGGTAGTNRDVTDDHTAVCKFPAHVPGVVDVVATINGVARTLVNGFTYTL